jgi:hypothetical protein
MTNQLSMFIKAQDSLSKRVRVFHQMQSGTNPLSNTEIQKLSEKNPETWTMFIGLGKSNLSNPTNQG